MQDFDDFKDLLILAGFWFAVILIIIIGLAVLGFVMFALIQYGIEEPMCNNIQVVNPHIPIKWTFWNGCLISVEDENMWIRYSDYMNFLNLR